MQGNKGFFGVLVGLLSMVIIFSYAKIAEAKKIDPFKCKVKVSCKADGTDCSASGDKNQMHSLPGKVANFNWTTAPTCMDLIDFENKPFHIVLQNTLEFNRVGDGDEDKDGKNFILLGNDKEDKRVVIDMTKLNLGQNGDDITYGMKIKIRKSRFSHLTLKVKDEAAAPYAIYNKVANDQTLTEEERIELHNFFEKIRIVDANDNEIDVTIDPNTGEITVKEEVVPTPTPPPTVPPLATDTDVDGTPDVADNCPENPNADQADFDEDGLGDVCDDDNDADSIADTDDNCPPIVGGDGEFQGQWIDTENGDQADADLDQIGDELFGP